MSGYLPGYHRSLLWMAPVAIVLTSVAPALAQNGDYQAKLAAYLQARERERAASHRLLGRRRRQSAASATKSAVTKWRCCSEDYVLEQPPVYSGPPRPVDPNTPPGPAPGEPPPIPVLTDFLANARAHFGFVPDRPANEIDFKRAYAKVALAYGLTRDQIVRVYAFETGGNGTYDMQAGVTPTRPRQISPAVGYNQLLSTNTISILAEHGARILSVLHLKAKGLNGPAKISMERKIEAAQAHDRAQPHRTAALGRLGQDGQDHAGRHRHSRRHSRPRHRPAAAGAEAGDLGALRAHERLRMTPVECARTGG